MLCLLKLKSVSLINHLLGRKERIEGVRELALLGMHYLLPYRVINRYKSFLTIFPSPKGEGSDEVKIECKNFLSD